MAGVEKGENLMMQMEREAMDAAVAEIRGSDRGCEKERVA